MLAHACSYVGHVERGRWSHRVACVAVMRKGTGTTVPCFFCRPMWIIVAFVNAKCCTKSELSIMDWENGIGGQGGSNPRQSWNLPCRTCWAPQRSYEILPIIPICQFPSYFIHIPWIFHEFPVQLAAHWDNMGQLVALQEPLYLADLMCGDGQLQGQGPLKNRIFTILQYIVSGSFIYVHVVDCDCISTVGVAVKLSHTHTHTHARTCIYIYIYKIDTCVREGLLICWCMPLAPLHRKATCLAGLSDGTVGALW